MHVDSKNNMQSFDYAMPITSKLNKMEHESCSKNHAMQSN